LRAEQVAVAQCWHSGANNVHVYEWTGRLLSDALIDASART